MHHIAALHAPAQHRFVRLGKGNTVAFDIMLKRRKLPLLQGDISRFIADVGGDHGYLVSARFHSLHQPPCSDASAVVGFSVYIGYQCDFHIVSLILIMCSLYYVTFFSFLQVFAAWGILPSRLGHPVRKVKSFTYLLRKVAFPFYRRQISLKTARERAYHNNIWRNDR